MKYISSRKITADMILIIFKALPRKRTEIKNMNIKIERKLLDTYKIIFLMRSW